MTSQHSCHTVWRGVTLSASLLFGCTQPTSNFPSQTRVRGQDVTNNYQDQNIPSLGCHCLQVRMQQNIIWSNDTTFQVEITPTCYLLPAHACQHAMYPRWQKSQQRVSVYNFIEDHSLAFRLEYLKYFIYNIFGVMKVFTSESKIMYNAKKCRPPKYSQNYITWPGPEWFIEDNICWVSGLSGTELTCNTLSWPRSHAQLGLAQRVFITTHKNIFREQSQPELCEANAAWLYFIRIIWAWPAFVPD